MEKTLALLALLLVSACMAVPEPVDYAEAAGAAPCLDLVMPGQAWPTGCD